MPEAPGWGAYVLVPGPLAPHRGPGIQRAPRSGVWSVHRLVQPSACVGTPAAQDHVSRGSQGLAGSHLQPALRPWWCRPCRGVLDQIHAGSVPAGFRSHRGRLSGSLSGFQFLGNQVWDRQMAGSLSPHQATFTPCCSSRAPLPSHPGHRRTRPLSARPSGSARASLPPSWTGARTAWRTAEWLAPLPQQAVWPLPVGCRPPGPPCWCLHGPLSRLAWARRCSSPLHR